MKDSRVVMSGVLSFTADDLAMCSAFSCTPFANVIVAGILVTFIFIGSMIIFYVALTSYTG